MKKNDKTQGVVFVLPKSREFFGRISQDFQKTGLVTQHTHPGLSETVSVPETQKAAEQEIEALQELKTHLSKLSQLHKRLKNLLSELDKVVEDDK